MKASLTLYGTPVVPGVSYAKTAWSRSVPEPEETAETIPAESRESEKNHFAASADAVAQRLRDRAANTVGTASDILAVSAGFAADKGWRREVSKRIDSGTPAVQAVAQATQMFVEIFEQAGGLMAERRTDLLDMRNRVIAELRGEPEPGVPVPDEPVILLADDLAPADTAGLDPDLIHGIITRLGGPTSHTSIICRQLGIPCIVAARTLSEVPEGVDLIMDGDSGEFSVDPDHEEAEALARIDAERRRLAREWHSPAQTKDGHTVEILANVQDEPGAARAEASEAAGIGLLRTELSFLNTPTEPSVEEQVEIYSSVFRHFPGQKIVVRTLDAGSDKPVAFASVPDEENPALGVRGLRTSGIDMGLLTRQIEALVQSAKRHDGPSWIMAPMVSTVAEARWFASMIREHGLTAGIMIEVPSAAIMIDQFLEEIDFVSIGTNDLTQYVMAADRGNANLATYTDNWQPAVLTLINHVAQAGIRHGKPVGVCGEAAADPNLAAVLIGMGVTSLSMASGAIPYVGSRLATVTLEQCREAAAAVLEASDPNGARQAALAVLNG
ncbi:phosphoenolpyruvate--protein phosphotransferase [Flaviflexus salsibiostraticola]|uniref:Phosphoenolpyruvate-protein phosphotransferase n=1 Tax=Flaviflexus salsibiostraticola TaxID=1282737 RepID=A0A3Q8WVH9_9ACTO|nr:phosphoenolpyruvate--protein phosphotransferase [Flaviflexus salsibiostraticola]AZN30092.1 phosphoenolpyruvate--protein phosphotransferase [Flaviflexus salsibiostraticola]